MANAQQQHAKLAALLRECAQYVERNEFHPDMYQALGLLHAYAGEHSGGNNTVDDRQITSEKASLEDSAAHIMNSLGKKFSKGLGLASTPHSQAHASATSQKNAARARADLEGMQPQKAQVGHRSKENDWCDEHFCLGCQCKTHKQQQQQTSSSGGSSSTSPTNAVERSTSTSPTPPASVKSTTADRPQQQQEASTPRVTTTTTTRPTTTPSKPAFQRPVNPNSILIANGWIEQQRRSKMRIVWKHVLASLVEGRKPGEETTLWIQREVVNNISGKKELEALHQIPIKWLTSVEYLDYSTDHRFALKVYNVAEEFTFRCDSAEAAQNWVLTLQSVREIAAKSKSASSDGNTTLKQESAPPTTSQSEQQQPTRHRMTISELRAIAHGAGISTAGMERQELEKAVANIAGGAQSDTTRQQAEAARRKQAMMDEQRRRGEAAAALEEKRRKQQALEEAAQREEAELRRKQREQAQAEEERRRRQEQQARVEAERRAAEEARKVEEERQRRRLQEERRAAEERRRKAQEEEERRRRVAAEQQAAAEQRRRQEEEQRRRVAAEQQQAAEAQRRRQQEEEQRRRWQQDQQRQQWQQQQWQQQQQQQARSQPQFGAAGGPQQQYRPTSPNAPPPPPHHANGAGAPTSPVNQKYAKMAAQDDDNGQAAITKIKHSILIHWALQPPQLQMLRPIDILITTIHNVFPPAFGVTGHEYFVKWKPLHREALLGPGNRPDEEKLKKSVRKLRFFLHPDKLPRDLNDEQQFMCKMLWDVTSDAWEEFEKHKEELDWIRG